MQLSVEGSKNTNIQAVLLLPLLKKLEYTTIVFATLATLTFEN